MPDIINRRRSWPVVLRSLAVGLACVTVLTSCRSGEVADDDALPGTPIASDHIDAVYQLSDKVISGGSPHDTNGFEQLRDLGVKTVISVDGAKPKVAMANAAGMRYVHLPIGYDGISRERALQISKAVQSSPGRVFIHCHHGHHRGPTAAAVALIATERWSNERSLAWMKQVKTSPDYQGLWQTTRAFMRPTAAELAAVSADFKQEVEGSPMVQAMGAIEQHHATLKSALKRGLDKGSPKENAHEALLLAEQYRELERHPDSRKLGDDYLARLAKAEQTAQSLRQLFNTLGALPANRRASAPAASEVPDVMARVKADCRSCHAKYRN